MANFVETLAAFTTIAYGLATFIRAAYFHRKRISLALCAMEFWALSALIRYVDFVFFYIFDPVSRMWDALVAFLDPVSRIWQALVAFIASYFGHR